MAIAATTIPAMAAAARMPLLLHPTRRGSRARFGIDCSLLWGPTSLNVLLFRSRRGSTRGEAPHGRWRLYPLGSACSTVERRMITREKTPPPIAPKEPNPTTTQTLPAEPTPTVQPTQTVTVESSAASKKGQQPLKKLRARGSDVKSSIDADVKSTTGSAPGSINRFQ
jgi:hypothetical protein